MESRIAITKSTMNTKSRTTGSHGIDRLSSLSPEILAMIANNITNRQTMSTFSRTSRRFYALMTPRLYHRIAVSVPYHAHIAKMIRAIEPLLTIQQKKQLKKEGKYKGQQEKYPTGLDQKKVPICASYVNSLVLGHTDPGKKHIDFVLRYYEELLQNTTNLEIVEAVVVNPSICKSLASLSSLKALSIEVYDTQKFKSQQVAPLAAVKDLRHFQVTMDHSSLATCQSILRNSMSTLRSLSWTGYYCHMLQDWSRNLTCSELTDLKFPDLRSISITGMAVDKEFVEQFPKVFDLPSLRDLSFCNLTSDEPFFTALAQAMSSYGRSNIFIHLRTLSVDMYDMPAWDVTLEHQAAVRAAKTSLIASFDTLTTLKIPQYGQYKNDVSVNPGLSDALLQAILKHKNLRHLSIDYKGVGSNLHIPYLGPKQVGKIIGGLPELREFTFAPDEPQMDEISKVLTRGRNLEHVTCFPHESWTAARSANDEPLGIEIARIIVNAYLTQATVDPDSNGPSNSFVWEEHCKLRRIDLSHTAWDVASDFGKKRKGDAKVERVSVNVSDNVREVCFRQVAPVRYNYDPVFSWTLKVENDIR